jgi:hypothetical protein
VCSGLSAQAALAASASEDCRPGRTHARRESETEQQAGRQSGQRTKVGAEVFFIYAHGLVLSLCLVTHRHDHCEHAAVCAELELRSEQICTVHPIARSEYTCGRHTWLNAPCKRIGQQRKCATVVGRGQAETGQQRHGLDVQAAVEKVCACVRPASPLGGRRCVHGLP